MRILIAAFGTRGDVQPAVVAARALEAAGHACECFVPPNVAEWVRSFGLTTTAVGLDYEVLVKVAAEGRLLDVLRALPKLRQEIVLHVESLREAASRADLVVGCAVFGAGQVLSDLYGVPYRYLALSSYIVPSRQQPGPLVRSQRLPGWLNELSWRFNERVFSTILRGPLNRLRRALGLKPAGEVWPALLSHSTVVACDPTVFPLGPALPSGFRYAAQQTGALFLDEHRPLSPAVEAFLRAGPPPVYVGFGSMGDPHPDRTVRTLLAAARTLKRRLLLARGWAGFTLGSHVIDPEQVLLIDAEPHGALFPRCAAVVHHGGIGTAHAALRAAVPQLIVPHLLDQHYSAHRIELAGVGLGLKNRHGFDGASFAAKLARVLAPQVVARAREVASGLILDGEARIVAALTSPGAAGAVRPPAA